MRNTHFRTCITAEISWCLLTNRLHLWIPGQIFCFREVLARFLRSCNQDSPKSRTQHQNESNEKRFSAMDRCKTFIGDSNGLSDRRYCKTEKTPPMRQSGMGDSAGGSGFPVKVRGLRAPGYGSAETRGKKHTRTAKKSLKIKGIYAIVLFCDI